MPSIRRKCSKKLPKLKHRHYSYHITRKKIWSENHGSYYRRRTKRKFLCNGLTARITAGVLGSSTEQGRCLKTACPLIHLIEAESGNAVSVVGGSQIVSAVFILGLDFLALGKRHAKQPSFVCEEADTIKSITANVKHIQPSHFPPK